MSKLKTKLAPLPDSDYAAEPEGESYIYVTPSYDIVKINLETQELEKQTIENDVDALVEQLLEEVERNKIIAVDLETSGLDAYVDWTLMVQIATRENNYIFRAEHFDQFLDRLAPLLRSKDVKKLGHNLVFDYRFISNEWGVHMAGIWDTCIVENCLTAGLFEAGRPYSASLAATVKRRLGLELDKTIRLAFVGRPRHTKFTHEEMKYGARDVSILFELYDLQVKEVEKHGLKKIVNLENSIIRVSAEMEMNGFALDRKKWDEVTHKYQLELLEVLKLLYVDFEDRCSGLQITLFEDVRTQIDAYIKALNMRSPMATLKMLKDQGIDELVGFEVEGTDKESLAKIQEALDVRGVENNKIKHILQFRKYNILLDNFMYKIPKMLNPKTGKLHPQYVQMPVEDNKGKRGGTTTGRYASKNPNFQQMPASEDIRHAFIAREGYKIVTCDYSSMEVRIAANFTKDDNLVNFFLQMKGLPEDKSLLIANPIVDPNDFHGYSASLVFQKPIEQVAKKMGYDPTRGEIIEVNPPEKRYRNMAKVATFATFYGAQAGGSFADKKTGKMIDYGLYLKLGISLKEAEEVIKRYNEAYPKAMQLLTSIGTKAYSNGYVIGCAGRKKYLDSGKGFKNASGRKARNYVIQETNATQMKLALFMVRKEFSTEDVKILATVHDEMVVEIREDKAYEYGARVREIMIEAANRVLKGPVDYDANFLVEDHWSK